MTDEYKKGRQAAYNEVADMLNRWAEDARKLRDRQFSLGAPEAARLNDAKATTLHSAWEVCLDRAAR